MYFQREPRTVDTLALVDLKECTACTPVCGERFSHLNMTTKAKGYKNQWVCMDREACLQRQLSGAGANAGTGRRGEGAAAPVGEETSF